MRRIGQWLRLIGLLIEAVGVYQVVRERGGQPATMILLPGGSNFSAAWAAVALGFLLWFVGKIAITVGGRTRRDGDRMDRVPDLDVSQALGDHGTMDRSPDHGVPDERPEDHVG